MTTYATLKSDCADWLNRTDLTTAIPSFVRLCEATIRRDVRVRAMDTTADITITSGAASLPTGFIEARRLILDNTTAWNLDYVTPEVLYSSEVYNESGTSVCYTIEGESLVFRPLASETAKMLYIKAFTALSGETDTNWLLTNAYDVYLYGTLLHAAPYVKEDARVATWAQLYSQAVQQVNKQDNLSRFSGSALKSMGEIPL